MASKPQRCPSCRRVNPASAVRCDCGYDFESGEAPATPAAAPIGVSKRAVLMVVGAGLLVAALVLDSFMTHATKRESVRRGLYALEVCREGDCRTVSNIQIAQFLVERWGDRCEFGKCGEPPVVSLYGTLLGTIALAGAALAFLIGAAFRQRIVGGVRFVAPVLCAIGGLGIILLFTMDAPLPELRGDWSLGLSLPLALLGIPAGLLGWLIPSLDRA